MKALKFNLVLICFVALFMSISFADYGAESEGYCDWGVPIHAITCDTAYYCTVSTAISDKADSLAKRGGYVPGDSFLVCYGDTFSWLIGDSVTINFLRVIDSLYIPQWLAAPNTGSSGLFGADTVNDSIIAFIGGTRAVVYPHPSVAAVDTATYADTVFGQVGKSGSCVDAYLDSVFGCSQVVFAAPVKIDSSLIVDIKTAIADSGLVIILDTLAGGSDVVIKGLVVRGTSFKDATQYPFVYYDRNNALTTYIDGTGRVSAPWMSCVNDMTITGDLMLSGTEAINIETATADTGLVITIDSVATGGGGDVASYGLVIKGTGMKDVTQYFIKCDNQNTGTRFYVNPAGECYALTHIANNLLQVNGETTLGNAPTDTVTITGDIEPVGHVLNTLTYSNSTAAADTALYIKHYGSRTTDYGIVVDMDTSENTAANVIGIDMSGSNAFNNSSDKWLSLDGYNYWGSDGYLITSYLGLRLNILTFQTDAAAFITHTRSQNIIFNWQAIDKGDIIFRDGNLGVVNADFFQIEDSAGTDQFTISNEGKITLLDTVTYDLIAYEINAVDSLLIPQWAAAPGTGSSGLFGADTTNDSIIAFLGGTRVVVYPQGGGMSGSDIIDSLVEYNTGSIAGSMNALIGGDDNAIITASTDNSAICGGKLDTIAADECFIGGGENHKILAGAEVGIVGGYNHWTSGAQSFLGGGYENYITGMRSATIGGYKDSVKATYSAIIAGYSNVCAGERSVIAGGENCDILAGENYSFIGAGRNSKVDGMCSSIIGGFNDSVYTDLSVAIGGYKNIVRGDTDDSCSVVMGVSSTVDSCLASFAMNCAIKKADSTFGVSKQIWVIEGTDSTKITAQGIDFTYEDPTIKRGYGIVSTDVVFDTGNVTVVTADDGWVVEDVYFEVTTTFDGDAVVTIGDAGDADGYLRDADINQGVAAYYGYESDERGDYLYDATNSHSRQKIYAASTAIVIYVTQTTATQGAGTVYVGLKRLK